MKIIDLLNKIANGEEVPKKIRYNGTIYYYDEKDDNELARYRSEGVFDKWLFDDCYLNDEVEIIEDTIEDRYREMEKVRNYKPNPSYLPPKEEKKIPEKLEIEQDTSSNYYIRNKNGAKCYLTTHSKMIIETLNQVIDYLESKGE